MTIDWEGAELSAEGFESLDALRKNLHDVPLTHFMSAGYFTRSALSPAVVAGVQDAVRPTDELAVHLHAWQSLVSASGVTPKTSPSFLTGTDELVAFDNGDVGFETDFDAYSVAELRAILRTSRALLARVKHPIAATFRAGGYLGTPKMLAALGSEGFAIDSSAIDHRQMAEVPNPFWLHRMEQLWPGVDSAKQPYVIATDGGPLLEMPLAGVADYVTVEEVHDLMTSALARLHAAPDRDVFVVLCSHFETGPEYSGRYGAEVAQFLNNDDVVFTTIDSSAELARSTATPL